MSISLISAPDPVQHAGNEMKVVVRTDLPLSTPNVQVKLGILVELVYDSGVFSAPGVVPELWADPAANGDCTFFIDEHLRDVVDKLLDIPAVAGTAAVKCMHMVRRYKLYAVEYSGDPQAATGYLTTGSIVNVRWAQMGGIPQQHFQLRSWFGSNGWAMLSLGNPFLDWRGPSLRTGRTQDQWVYFNWQDAFSIISTVTPVLHCEYTLEDGLSDSFTQNLVSMDAKSVWMIPVGFAQLGLPAIETTEGQRILKYRVWLQQTIGMTPVALVEVKEFVVDHQYYEWNTEVMYLNGLHTFTQLLLRGRKELVTEVEAMESRAYHEKGMPTYLGETYRHGTEVSNVVSHASGGLTAAELKLMRELLGSRKVMVKDAALGWLPVTILNKKQAQSELETARTVELQWVSGWGSEVVDMFSY